MKNEDKSISELVGEIKSKCPNHSFSIAEIKEKIVSDQLMVASWLEYCESKRTSTGWFIKKEGSNWQFGYLESCDVIISSSMKKEEAFSMFIYTELMGLIADAK